MDAKQLGNFIAERRKELGYTQASLAEKLHVTDKAVSKWERGAGLPDIGNIERLAEALEVSLVELMQAKQNVEPKISTEEAETILLHTIELSKGKTDHKPIKIIGRITIGGFAVICILLLGILIYAGFQDNYTTIGSLVAGMVSWVIPLWNMSVKHSKNMTVPVISSLGLAALSLIFCFLYISSEVYSGDFSALLDVTDALIGVVVLYVGITFLLNIVAVKNPKKDKKFQYAAMVALNILLFFIMFVMLMLMGTVFNTI